MVDKNVELTVVHGGEFSQLADDGLGDGVRQPAPPLVSVLGDHSSYRSEARAVVNLALPLAVSGALSSLLNVTDLIFIGQMLTADQLAAAALGNTIFNMFFWGLVGAGTAVDTLAGQAVGAGQHQLVGVIMQRGFVTLMVLMIPAVMVLLFFADAVLQGVFREDAELSAQAAQFCQALVVGLPFGLLYQVMVKFCVVQNVTRPPVLISVVANVFNAVANYVFIKQFGFIGSPLATTATRILQPIVMLWYLRRYRPHNPVTWNGLISLSSACRIKSMMGMALAGGFALMLESFAFEVSTMAAGMLDPVSLDAHSILLSLAGLAFLSLPFPVAMAATVLVGNRLGEGRPEAAKKVSRVAIVVGTGSMMMVAITMSLARNHVGYLFTSDKEVVDKVASIVMICALFQTFDGLDGVTGGVLRGMGKQHFTGVITAVAFYIVGAPVSVLLTLRSKANLGVAGLWWGLTVGLVFISCAYGLVLPRIDWDQESRNAKHRVAQEQKNQMPLVVEGIDGGGSGRPVDTAALLTAEGEGDEDEYDVEER